MNGSGEHVERSCLITGATGFVGSHLARTLASKGWNVHAVLRPYSDEAALGRKPGLRPIALHRHDGSMEGMLAIVRRAKPDVVFHLASLVMSIHEPGDVEPLLRSNVLLGTQLLEALAGEGRGGLLVNTATAWQHYDQQDYSPTCLYAATKQAFEAILTYYTEIGSIQAITLTLFDTYGPHDRRPKLFQLLREASRSGRVLEMTPGAQRIDLIHIDDVVRGYELAAERLLSGRVHGSEQFALSSGTPIQLKDAVRLYECVTGYCANIAWGAKPYRHREIMTPWNGGKRLPGWSPSVRLEEGMKTLDTLGEASHSNDTRL